MLASASELDDRRRVLKRVSLTGQMLLDITVPGGLAVGQVGYRTVRRVRLLHACVRALLLLGDAAGNPWPTAARGLPINQQDMMGTQLAFTTAAFEGIERLGYRMPDGQARLPPSVERRRALSRCHGGGRLRRYRFRRAAHAGARGGLGKPRRGAPTLMRTSSTTWPR